MKLRRVAVPTAAAVIAVASSAGAVTSAAKLSGDASGRACAGAWRPVASPAVRDGELNAVTVRTADDAWAVGSRPLPPKRRTPLVEHWDGRRWAIVPGLRVAGTLLSVTTIAADDAWAVGSSADVPALVVHWDGRSWRLVPVSWSAQLAGVSATSASDVWAVGSTGAGAIVLHWDGSRWRRVVRRQKATLEAVAALSPTDVWAVGADDEQKLLALHWDGIRWRAFVVEPEPGEDAPVRLTAVAAFSPRDVWAVGDAHEADAPGYRGHGVVLHWNGGAWTHGPTLYDASGLFSVAASPPRDLWVAGVDAFRFATEGGEGAFVARRRARWNVTPLEKRLVRGLGVQPDGTIIGVGFAGSGIDEVGNGFPIRTRPLVLRSTC